VLRCIARCARLPTALPSAYADYALAGKFTPPEAGRADSFAGAWPRRYNDNSEISRLVPAHRDSLEMKPS